MKSLKSIITILAISLSTVFSTSANNADDTKTKTSELRTEIISMLGNKINLEFKKTGTAEVSFLINKKNEVVVISVDSKLKEVNSFIKNRLNYKHIDTKGIKTGEIYKMSVKIKA